MRESRPLSQDREDRKDLEGRPLTMTRMTHGIAQHQLRCPTDNSGRLREWMRLSGICQVPDFSFAWPSNAPSPVIPPLASDLPPVAPVASGNMRILRRPSPSSAPASGSSTPTGGPKPVKTLSEREEEYRRARERIFAEDKAKEQKAKDNERAREKPRDSVDEVIRAAEAMVLAGENEAESSRGGYGGGAVRNRGRQKSKQTLQDDDFETRTELAMRSSSVEIMYPSITPYGIPLPYMSTGTPGRLPSRSGSGTTSPIGPGGFNDPYGGVDSYMVPLRNPSEIGIVRQPRGPVAGEGTGFGALRSGPAAGATR